MAPGVPDLEAQEKRDRVPAGTYRRLHETGSLRVAEGLRVQPPASLHGAALDQWGPPVTILADRFRVPELKDCVGAAPLVPRISRWSEAAYDVRALRQMAKDGPLSCAEGSRSLLAASLSVALVKNDDQGNVRLSKRSRDNTARDDVAAALVLAAGAWLRSTGRPRRKMRSALAG